MTGSREEAMSSENVSLTRQFYPNGGMGADANDGVTLVSRAGPRRRRATFGLPNALTLTRAVLHTARPIYPNDTLKTAANGAASGAALSWAAVSRDPAESVNCLKPCHAAISTVNCDIRLFLQPVS